MNRILIVDDESGVRAAIRGVLQDEGFQVSAVSSGEECLKLLAGDQRFEAIILDVWLPELDGLEVLRRAHELDPTCPVIVISGHGTIETAVKATKLGAFDFLEKPLSLDKTVLTVQNALKQRRLEEENRRLKEKLEESTVLLGETPAIRSLREQIAIAAPSNGRVLILGDNGTGKELVARAIHAQSRRAAQPFVEVNCAAIPEELIESELFGHVRGAFTGATANKRGKFELADGGTLFLDEIGDMSLKTQAKVLRALQEGRIEPVGGSGGIDIDVRVIAATNKNLEEELRGGRFRDDLYYRLNVVPLRVPPLRERREDIPLLANHFLRLYGREYGRAPKQLEAAVVEALRTYDWPGNVRELRNMMERFMITVLEPVITLADLPAALREPGAVQVLESTDLGPLRQARERFETDYIRRALQLCRGNVSQTARILGVERSHLYRKLRAYGLLNHREPAAVAAHSPLPPDPRGLQGEGKG